MLDPSLVSAFTVPLAIAGVIVTFVVVLYRHATHEQEQERVTQANVHELNVQRMANEAAFTLQRRELDLETAKLDLEKARLRTAEATAKARRPTEVFCPICGQVATTINPVAANDTVAGNGGQGKVTATDRHGRAGSASTELGPDDRGPF